MQARRHSPFYAVLSTGRCGTVYLSKVLRASGLDIAWEAWGRDGGIGWPLVAGNFEPSENVKILHQTREAKACISSFQSFTPRFWSRIRAMGLELTGDRIVDCMRYYLDWNRRIAQYTDKVFFIESLIFPRVQARLEAEFARPLRWEAAKSSSNRRDYRLYTWEELIRIDPQLATECKVLESELLKKGSAYYDSGHG